MNWKYITLTLFFVAFVMLDLYSQCPMCKIAAESNLEAGGTEGKGLNKGILYMLTMPYLLVATLGFIWWKNNKQVVQNENPL